MTWVVQDVETNRPYLELYVTRAEAVALRADLLRGYPEGHVWRARLKVVAWDGVRLPRRGTKTGTKHR